MSGPRIIESVETVRWSWHKALVEFKRLFVIVLGVALLIGCLSGVAAALLLGWLSETSTAITRGSEMGLSIGVGQALAAVVTMGLVLGLKAGEIEAKTVPNQGIRRSARNAMRVGVLFLLVTGLVIPVLFNTMFGYAHLIPRDFALGSLAFPIGVIAGLVYGGFACIQHLVLRALLWRSGVIPWNYARFLDEAAERLLLRKVGGGYIFVHRLLLEHFAGRAIAPSDQADTPTLAAPMERHV